MTNLLYPRNNIATPLKKIGWIRDLAGELNSQWEENYIRNVSESRDKRVCQNKSPDDSLVRIMVMNSWPAQISHWELLFAYLS